MIIISTDTILYSFILLGLFLLLAKWIRLRVPLLQRYFIPTSLIAGAIGLLITQDVPQRLITLIWPNNPLKGHTFISNGITEVWDTLPKILITIIFASLFLGKKIPNVKQIWKSARPIVALGQTIAWGQYVVGLLLAIFLLEPFFDFSPLSGALIEISFQGGPGTAAGLQSTFSKLGFEEGADIALALASVGILSGVITGILIVNWGIRRNKTSIAKKPSELSDSKRLGIYKDEDVSLGKLTTRSNSIETLTVHFSFIFVSIGIGFIIHKSFVELEKVSWGQAFDFYLFEYVPLFPLAMVGGFLIQLTINKLGYENFINRNIVKHIQNLALDFLIVAAVTNLSLAVIGEHFMVFIILALAGVGWNVFSFFIFAPRMISEHWFERGIIDFGQSMGMTTTGLLLLQIVDPKKETPAFESFGYKQLFFEPIVGGGLFTAAALPLISRFGAVSMLIFTSILFIFWLSFGLWSKQKNS